MEAHFESSEIHYNSDTLIMAMDISSLFLAFAYVAGAGLIFFPLSKQGEVRYLSTLLGFFCLWSAFLFVTVPLEAHPLIKWTGLTAVFVCGMVWVGTSVQTLSVRASQRFMRRKQASIPPYLMEIGRALDHLSKRKVGALIVLERNQPVNPHTRGGLPFEGAVKSEILISLFTPPSLVHDGALIIRKERIRAVKVVLPLATQREVPLGVGTRHRAALSISEKTDALALVVSEERGETALAFRGDLVKAPTPEEFQRLVGLALRGKKIKSAVLPEKTLAFLAH